MAAIVACSTHAVRLPTDRMRRETDMRTAVRSRRRAQAAGCASQRSASRTQKAAPFGISWSLKS